MNNIIEYIIHSYNSLWKIKKHGNTVEVITPVATTNNFFVSVFLTKREDEYIVTDGGWIDSGIYECKTGFEDVYYYKLFQYYLEDYEIQQLQSKGHIYYYKKISNVKLVPNLVYDLSNFINAVVSASFISFEEKKEKEHIGRFRREANRFIRNLVSEKNLKTNSYIHESISSIKFNAVVFRKNRMTLINYVTGSNDTNFILSLGRSNLSYDAIENHSINKLVTNKITLLDDTTRTYESPKVQPLLKTVEHKEGRLCTPWSAKKVLEEISQNEHEQYLAELREKYIMAKIFMLEGYDGSGKTSVAKEIAKRLGIRYCHFYLLWLLHFLQLLSYL